MRRHHLAVGVAVVAVYVVALIGTVVLRDGHVRPLYDAFVPPSSYRFVDPPAFFNAGNVQPTGTSTTITLGTGGSKAAGVATPDGQFVINLGRGDIAAAKGASAVSVTITPLAPRHLGPVPGGLRPNGNAYRVQMRYEPHGRPVTKLANPGTLLVEIPEVGRQLFASADGERWSLVPSRVISASGLTMTATLVGPGYYLAATSLPELAAPAGHSSHVAIVVGVVVAVLAAVMFLVASLVVRKRRGTVLGETD
jgi:hypothetical protein